MLVFLNIIFSLLIIFFIWWFWLSKPRAKKFVNDTIVIIIKDGTYSPSRVEASADNPITLEFIRKDKSPCSAQVVFADLDIHHEIPFNKKLAIQLGKLEKGTYHFSCQMNMYKGALIVT